MDNDGGMPIDGNNDYGQEDFDGNMGGPEGDPNQMNNDGGDGGEEGDVDQYFDDAGDVGYLPADHVRPICTI